ncbi:UPF0619 GPI-anchored membrane protein [Penicillium cataractarum]|uniref:UPF0619 GPI-anchored membrane protein n=1 Tax=Penicillium cataractarum TaxID=2100454 RepID=A0A9W9SP27_9EURO|nr:UPF0619 GPI-anchored membrane protein [Penicillium cataractarum]KAJ5380854.1 UPF0619 GPI-anchored membrane protein [Penicillium cataractarum]
MRVTFLSSLVAFTVTTTAILVTYPPKGAKIDWSKPVTIKWDSVETDPSTFDLYVVNQAVNPSVSTLVASDIETSKGSYTIKANNEDLTTSDTGGGYQIDLKSSSGDGILAQSQQFKFLFLVYFYPFYHFKIHFNVFIHHFFLDFYLEYIYIIKDYPFKYYKDSFIYFFSPHINVEVYFYIFFYSVYLHIPFHYEDPNYYTYLYFLYKHQNLFVDHFNFDFYQDDYVHYPAHQDNGNHLYRFGIYYVQCRWFAHASQQSWQSAFGSCRPCSLKSFHRHTTGLLRGSAKMALELTRNSVVISRSPY